MKFKKIFWCFCEVRKPRQRGSEPASCEQKITDEKIVVVDGKIVVVDGKYLRYGQVSKACKMSP